MNTSCRIMVLGREIPVRTTAKPELVAKIEALVNDRLAMVAATLPVQDSQLTAILALLNMAEEIIQLQEILERDDSMTTRLKELVAQLDAGLAACP